MKFLLEAQVAANGCTDECSRTEGSLQAAAMVRQRLSVGDAHRVLQTNRMLQCKGMVLISGILWKCGEDLLLG